MLMVNDKHLNLIAAHRYLEEHPEDDSVEWEEGARVFELLRGGQPQELHGVEAQRRRDAMAALF